jgi:hypothetical protein
VAFGTPFDAVVADFGFAATFGFSTFSETAFVGAFFGFPAALAGFFSLSVLINISSHDWPPRAITYS